jgi:TatD DNase family protein
VSTFIDLHSHHQTASQEVETVYNVMLNEDFIVPEGYFSAGLHPWFANKITREVVVERLVTVMSSPKMMAVGEIGLDKACKIPLKLQQDIFEIQLQLAVANKKPVIIHCVRAWDDLIETSANFKTTKIIHGFNGSLELTERLLKANFSFSVGEAILNPNSKIQHSIKIIPVSSLYFETDDSSVPIHLIYENAGIKMNMERDDLKDLIFENFVKLGNLH